MDMEQEILRLEASLREKDGQLSSFKSILEQTQAELGGAREHGEELATRLERVASEHSKEVETLSLELAELQTALDVSREKTRQLERDVERQGREGEEGREKVEREMEARKEELSAVSSLLEGQKQALQEAEEKLSERDAELVRVTAELQVCYTSFYTENERVTECHCSYIYSCIDLCIKCVLELVQC